jgi:hypothetical protein
MPQKAARRRFRPKGYAPSYPLSWGADSVGRCARRCRMEAKETLIFLMKIFILVTTPVTFLVGLFLLYDIDTYLKIEKFLSQSYGVSRKRWADWVDKNRESLQVFLIKKRRLLGIICLLNAIGVFVGNLVLIKRH